MGFGSYLPLATRYLLLQIVCNRANYDGYWDVKRNPNKHNWKRRGLKEMLAVVLYYRRRDYQHQGFAL